MTPITAYPIKYIGAIINHPSPLFDQNWFNVKLIKVGVALLKIESIKKNNPKPIICTNINPTNKDEKKLLDSNSFFILL